MSIWVLITIGVLILAAGASLQAVGLAFRRRAPTRPSAERRARRAARRRP